jgi:hypothetical protein
VDENAEDIWNRALDDLGRDAGPGDRALADVLLLHGMVENGGVLHALEALTKKEVRAACAGLRYLALDAAAELLERTQAEIGRGALRDESRADALEQSTDVEWRAVVPDDDTIDEALRRRLGERPDDFAPLDGGRAPRRRWFGR